MKIRHGKLSKFHKNGNQNLRKYSKGYYTIITIPLYDMYVFISRDRLSASDMLQVRKVIEHVYEKGLGQGSETGSQSAGQDRTDDKDEDSTVAEEKVELLCNDQV